MAKDTESDEPVKKKDAAPEAGAESQNAAPVDVAKSAAEALRAEAEKLLAAGSSGYEFHQKGEKKEGEAAVSRVAQTGSPELTTRGLVKPEKAGADQRPAGQNQASDANGKVVTKLGPAGTLEFDPKNKENPYTVINANGEKKAVADGDKVGPNGETLKDLKEKGLSSESVKVNGIDSTKTTYPDGSVRSVFNSDQVVPGGVLESISYPAGREDQKRLVERIKGKEPATSSEDSAQTRTVFQNRTETAYDSGPVERITSITGAKAGQATEVTDYRNGPNGEKQSVVFKDDPRGVDKASLFSKPGEPDKIVYNYKDGHSESMLKAADKTLTPSEMRFPAHENDPRGKSSVTYGADRVETKFENPYDVGGGAKIGAVESRQDGTTVYKDGNGKELQLNPEQLEAAQAALKTPLHELTTPVGDKVSYMADGSRITQFATNGQPQPGQELARQEYPFPRNGILIDASINPGPDGVNRKVVYADGRVEAMRAGQGADQLPPVAGGQGDIEFAFGSGDRAGRMYYNSDSGCPSRMSIGDRNYGLEHGADGRMNRMSIQSKDGGSLELQRGADGRLQVMKADGSFKPDANGKISVEGLPVQIGQDGKIVGELTLNKKGDLRYKTDNGPARHEYVRRADGTMEDFDLAKWKRSTYSPDGQLAKTTFWDGFEWRQGTQSADGKRTEFAPEQDKPSFVERVASNGPPSVDQTRHGFQTGRTVDADWGGRMQVERLQGPPASEKTRYFNGAEYREAGSANVLENGDTHVVFKEPGRGQPIETIFAKDGRTINKYADNTQMAKDSRGYISEIRGPRGNYQFDRDPDGDIRNVKQFDHDGKMIESFTRRGAEKNSGMESWLSRQSLGVRGPGERPPRDLNKPTDFNTFVNSRGETISVNMNVTADGTLRREYPGEGGTPYFTYDRIEADNYREMNGRSIIDRSGGVTETVDNTKNPPEQSVTFKRNGIDFNLHSKDGPILVDERGFVTQSTVDQKSMTIYTADGAIASLSNNDGKPAYVEAKIPAGNGQFKSLKVGQENVKELTLRRDGKVQATIGDGTVIFNPKNSTVAQTRQGEKFMRVGDITTGEMKAITTLNGEPLWEFNKDNIVSASGNTFQGADKWDLNQAQADANANLTLKSKDGKEEAYLQANGTFIETRDGKGLFSYPDKSKAVLDKAGTLEKVQFGDKEFQPLIADGKIAGLKQTNGDAVIKPVPADANFKFDKDTGKFATEFTESNGVKSRTVWNTTDNTYAVERSWNGAKNTLNRMSVTMNAQGQVVKFKLPDGSGGGESNPIERKVADIVAAEKEQGRTFNIAYENNRLVTSRSDGIVGKFEADGSYTWNYSTPNGAVTNSFDRMNQMVANPEEGARMVATAEKITTGDQAAMAAFANSIVGKVTMTNAPVENLNSFVKTLGDSYFSKMNPAASVAAQVASDGSVTFTVTRNGKSFTHKVPRQA